MAEAARPATRTQMLTCGMQGKNLGEVMLNVQCGAEVWTKSIKRATRKLWTI